MDTTENRRATVASSIFCLANIMFLETIALSTQCRATFALKCVQTRANFGDICAIFMRHIPVCQVPIRCVLGVFVVYSCTFSHFYFSNNSRTSVAGTLMARLPWIFRSRS